MLVPHKPWRINQSDSLKGLGLLERRTVYSHSSHCLSANCETQKLTLNLPHSLPNEGNQIKFFWSVSPSILPAVSFSKSKHSRKMGVDCMLASSGCIDFFYPVGIFPTIFHVLNLLAPPVTEEPQRSPSEREGTEHSKRVKEGFTKIKGEPKEK